MNTAKLELVPRYKGHVVALVVITLLFLVFGLRIVQKSASNIDVNYEVYLILIAVLLSLGATLFEVSRLRRHQKEVFSAQQQEIDFGLSAINSHCIVSITDPYDRIIEVNQKFLDIFEYERDEVIGKSPRVLHDDIGGLSVFSAIKMNLSQGRAWVGEHCAITKTGSRKLFQTTVIPLINEHGQHVKSISLRTDVTELRSAEANRQMRALLDNLQDELYIYRVSDLSISYVNLRACERCEWDPQDYQTRYITDTDPKFDEAMFRAHVAPLLTGEQSSVVIQVQQEKGPVEISTRVFEGPDGEAVFVSVLRDLKERKALERAKMSSVSVVSHELRTPLTSISGSLRMLQGKFQPQLAGPAAGLVDIAVRNCERLMLIVNDILDLEKIEAGQVEFEREPLDIYKLAHEAIVINKGYADEFGVTFEVVADAEHAFVKGDSARLMQVMSNLMSNAAKYSKSKDTIKIFVEEHGTNWRLTVSDNGPGIPKDAQSRLFTSFSQLPSADGKKRTGTGLGLAITKTIIEKHGGRTGVDSDVGKGSRFYFDLPKLEA